MPGSNGENSVTEIFYEAMETRLHALIVGIEDLDEYKKENDKLKKCLREIKDILPKEKKKLTVELDDFFSSVLSVCENYYYKNGFMDALRLKSLVDSNKTT